MGSGRVELFKILFPNKHDGFADLFVEELDSWFSADIACCDACYDDFVRLWPGTYIRDMEFQKSGINLGCFYSGSDLSEIFTEEEFWKNIKEIYCPRCGCALNANIWPYNFPFSVPAGFEENANQIAEIATKTPFLILKHPFAQRVYDEIQRVSDDIKEEVLKTHYRGRLVSAVKNCVPQEFGPPPPDATPEGRYNHAGLPVLYMSNDKKTVYLEKDKQNIYTAEIEALRPVRIISFLDEIHDNDVLNALIYSSLLSAPDRNKRWDRPEYIFSRFVADCVKSANLDGIRYPTTKASIGHNLVLFNKSADWSNLIRIDNIEIFNPHD